MKGKKIISKRLSLLPVCATHDMHTLNQYYNETYLLIGRLDSNSYEQTKYHILKENDDPNTYYWGIYVHELDTLIGTISLEEKSKKIGVTGAMIGLDFVNKGFGTEAKHLLLNYAFSELGFIKILAYIYSYNPRSRACALKTGYIQEATVKEIKLYENTYWDEWILSITQQQWIPVWNKYKKRHGL